MSNSLILATVSKHLGGGIVAIVIGFIAMRIGFVKTWDTSSSPVAYSGPMRLGMLVLGVAGIVAVIVGILLATRVI